MRWNQGLTALFISVPHPHPGGWSIMDIQWVFNEYLRGALKEEIHLSLKLKLSICKPQVLSVPTHH